MSDLDEEKLERLIRRAERWAPERVWIVYVLDPRTNRFIADTWARSLAEAEKVMRAHPADDAFWAGPYVRAEVKT